MYAHARTAVFDFLVCTLRVVRVSCAVIKKHPVAWYLVTGIGLRNMVSGVGYL